MLLEVVEIGHFVAENMAKWAYACLNISTAQWPTTKTAAIGTTIGAAGPDTADTIPANASSIDNDVDL